VSESLSPRPTIGTAAGRWAGLGPYYAMFPIGFAFDVVQRYSQPGQRVLDPFAGRASSVYAASVEGRFGCGIEINPVGYLYGKVKLDPAPPAAVLARLVEVGRVAAEIEDDRLQELPDFFLACYTPHVLRYLLAARSVLAWDVDQTDATLMAIILVHLHGKREGSLSNQMRQGKAMSPDYSVRWWNAHNLTPPDVDPVEFLTRKVAWRYAKGLPLQAGGEVVLGDSLEQLNTLVAHVEQGKSEPFDLLFTSPPYYDITDYHYDQWLRLWMLGGPSWPTHRREGAYRGKFQSKSAYQELLTGVFDSCARLLAPNATVYVRTDRRDFTYQTTNAALQAAFPDKVVEELPQPFTSSTQTALYGDKETKPGEVDIILRPSA